MITAMKNPNDAIGNQTATFRLATQSKRNTNYFTFEELRLVDCYEYVGEALHTLPFIQHKKSS
jgi:hypothetical protein